MVSMRKSLGSYLKTVRCEPLSLGIAKPLIEAEVQLLIECQGWGIDRGLYCCSGRHQRDWSAFASCGCCVSEALVHRYGRLLEAEDLRTLI